MANYLFSVDGEETAEVGKRETAFVYNLDFFDTTDKVTGAPKGYPSTLAFDIGGDIDLDLTGYAGITGFTALTAQSAVGGVHLTIGQDFENGGYDGISAESLSNRPVVLDASAVTEPAWSQRLSALSDGPNVLIGGAGDDLLSSGAGADRFDGGGGFDNVALGGSMGVTVDLATGTGHGGDAEGDIYISIEGLSGTNFADRIIGGAGSHDLWGVDGNDVLSTSEGRVFGGFGDDVLIVSSRITRCVGGPGIDQVNFQIDPDGAVIDLLDNDPYEDTFIDIENVYGSGSNDRFYGDGGRNILEAVGGDDVLDGRGGSDVLRGGAGADQLNGGGGEGSDTVSYYLSSIGVTVDLATGTGHGGEAEGDTLTGFEILSGSQGDDSLTGDTLANTLQGWNGSDVLTGGGGKDMLFGGAGADRFVFTTIGDSVTGANADRITDFSHAQGDRIDLSAIDADTGVAGDQAFTFIGNALYSGIAGELRYHSDGVVTTVAGDINGDKVSDFHIQLTGAIGVVAGDFVL
ncbi:MAG: calcium-binding protein [Inquilinus sp.]|uniref:calcium-binding protein n=1 Tax=Inquilinus sp. TaxID=1932117 RepID=UPI003F3A59E9